MKRSPRRTAAALSAAALVALAGCGATAASQTAAQTTGNPARGAPTSSDLSSAAATLGISSSKLAAALDATRPAAGQRPSGDPMAALAKRLGLPVAKVRDAMRSVMGLRGPPQGGAGQGAPPQGSAPDGSQPQGSSPDGSQPQGSSPQATETPSEASPS
jgi:hypothetical protein